LGIIADNFGIIPNNLGIIGMNIENIEEARRV
jgi:hypothetical protein